MAKKKDLGEVVQIRYIDKRDTPTKFQKILRKVFTEEKRNLLIDMVSAPELKNDYLNHLIFSTQSLRTQGYTVTFVLSPENYGTFKSSPNAKLFLFEIGTIVSKSEITSMVNEYTQSVLEMPGFTIENNIVTLTKDSLEDLEEHFKEYVKKLLVDKNDILVDITKLTDIPGKLIHLLILSTIQHGKSFTVRIKKEQESVLQQNPQAMILNLKIYEEPKKTKNENFQLNFDEETQARQAIPIVEEQDSTNNIPVEQQKDPLEDFSVEQKISHYFKININTLEMGDMPQQFFIKHFQENLEKLTKCGNQLYIDIRDFKNIDDNIMKKLLLVHFELAIQNKILSFKMLPKQYLEWEKCIPKVEQLEKKIEKKPEFNVLGSRLEVHNVSPQMFANEFSTYFKKLLSTGNNSIIIDISNMEELSSSCIELLILNYLEAVGRGLGMLLRIRPEMEELFKKSGRGRSLPLEIIKPDYQKSSHFSGGKVGAIDMSKIQDAIEKDKLTNKVLDKKFESVHIESRGSFQNWEPVPVLKTDVEKKFSGAEKRLSKRYVGDGVEILFARGSLGKITGRRYKVNNISQSGLCFSCTSQLSKAEQIRIKLHYEDNPGIEITGAIVWNTPVASQALFRTGVKFNSLSHLIKVQIQEILKKIYRSQNP